MDIERWHDEVPMIEPPGTLNADFLAMTMGNARTLQLELKRIQYLLIELIGSTPDGN